MTVLVASLFLPYTVHFDISRPEPKPELRPAVSLRHASVAHVRAGELPYQRMPSLFAQGLPGPTPLPSVTPGIATEHEEFFLSNRPSSAGNSYFPPVGKAQLIAPSDPHSPTWGHGPPTQPFFRPKSPPPESISEQARQRVRAARSQAIALSDSREQSHERKLKYANWSIAPGEQGNGGLRNAVNAACVAGSLKDKLWVGTLGMPTDALENDRRVDIADKLESEFDSIAVFPKDSDFDGHYSHYCKTMLWPVFHYQIPDNPKSKAYQDHSWKYYVKVNQAFADRIVKSWKRGDILWIHDYHLLLVPAMVRRKLPEAQIGFFLHVAFPSSEVFRCLAVRNELLDGMLGANVIGFQTHEYCHHFFQTCNRLLGAEATPDGVQLEDRFVNVGTFTIGIDLKALSTRREDPVALDWLHRMQAKYHDKMLIVARDKLDHVRGVRQKLLAYELFLNKYPQFREKVVLIQVATSTTEQAELDATVSDIVTRINSIHSTLAHQPLVFLKQDMETLQHLAMLSAADVLLVTSLREGMNLTSHEFLFCQDGKHSTKKHGVLILSEFTGSASIFNGNELSVNPWDYQKCAEAIKNALEMSIEERERRWSRLMEAVSHHDAERWLTAFLDTLNRVWKQHSRQDTLSIPRLSISELSQKYQAANRRLFILDYEGTLAAHGSQTSIVFTSPQRTLDTLTNLVFDDKNIVYVMSARKPEEMDRLFRRVPKLGLIAENGCFLKEYGTERWVEVANMEKMTAWKKDVAGILEYYEERTEGSWVEERHCSLVWHYNDAKDKQGATRQAGECANHINDACLNYEVHAIILDGELVVESMEFNKGTAATHIFEGLTLQSFAKSLEPPEFLMVAGDSREDEAIYRWANQLGKDQVVRDVTTVSVSSRNTEATATLTQGVTGVLSALQKLANIT